MLSETFHPKVLRHWKDWGLPSTRFGALLKELRNMRGLSQKALGEKAGLSHVAIGDWERGKRNPKRDNVEVVALALGVDSRELLLAAGFMPKRELQELTRDLDPDALARLEAYTGMDRDRKQDLRELAEHWRERDRRRSIGGGVPPEEEGHEDDHNSAPDER